MSILDGTWASGAPPKEYVDFQIMKTMPWSWEELEKTPPYVRGYCWDFIVLERRAQLSRDQDDDRAAQSRSGVRRVKR